MTILIVCETGKANFIDHYTSCAPDGVTLLETRDIHEVHAIQDAYDVVIYEWGNKFTNACLRKKPKGEVIVRIHDHEITKGIFDKLDHVNWHKVDAFWFINKQVQSLFTASYPQFKTFYVPNVVNASWYAETQAEPGKIGLMSLYTRPRKRIDRAIELMKHLPDWELHIMADPMGYEAEYNRLKVLSKGLPVVWHCRPAYDVINARYPKQDINDFFADKAVVLSTSEHEGFHYAVAEGGLCGCMPVVYDWEFGGANEFWQPYVWESLEGMADAIRNYKKSSIYANYVKMMFHPELQWHRLWNEILEINCK